MPSTLSTVTSMVAIPLATYDGTSFNATPAASSVGSGHSKLAAGVALNNCANAIRTQYNSLAAEIAGAGLEILGPSCGGNLGGLFLLHP